MSKFKILCCCGAGMGTCMMIALRIEKVMKKLGVEYSITKDNVSSGKCIAKSYDVVFTNHNLAKNFEAAQKAGTVVIGLENVNDMAEMERKFTEQVLNKG